MAGLDKEGAITGLIWVGAMGAASLIAFNPIRRYLFEWFYYWHWLLVLVAVGLGIIHAGGLFLGGVALWAVDVVIRYMVLMPMYPGRAQLTMLPADVCRLTFPKGRSKLNFQAGQYVWVCVPSISPLQFHPFSISSSPFQEDVMLTIRALGVWTKALLALAEAHKDDADFRVTVYMEGPCGEPEVDLWGNTYQHFLFVSGGIGITPMQSICSALVNQMKRGRPVKAIWFIWSVRDRFMVNSIFSSDQINQIRAPAKANLPHSFSPSDLLVDSEGQTLVRADDQLNIRPNSFSNREQLWQETAAVSKDAKSPLSVAMDLPSPAADPSSPLTSPAGVSPSVLKLAFYLTKPREQKDWAEGKVDPATQPYLRFGRPKLSKLLESYRQEIMDSQKRGGMTRVAVCSCGPVPMIDEARALCAKFSTSQVRFDFHSEVFLF
eukprot:gb/GEZN01004828.1/.p1 GENE.gb/GEZN01004828.1/~~gb/GEZN01004828.1/.p1  ORF type:complete len:507 (+),score=69.62 gb/GEZN01004828.1/:217-1521(+)